MNCGISSRPVGAEDAADARRAAVPHRADLEDRKWSPPVPQALLAKEHRTAIFDEDGHDRERHHRREDHEAGARAGDIERAFEP